MLPAEFDTGGSLMRSILMLFAATSALATSLLAAPPAPGHFDGGHFDGKAWWKHVQVLADDNMEGRETGSPGLRRAQAYIVDQLTKAGLKPAGRDGFYQPVKFVQREIDESKSAAALVRDGKAEPLTLGEDAFFSTRVDLAAEEIKAPLVFIGYGLKIPEKNYDDFAGLDLKGKIAVSSRRLPRRFPRPLASHYQTPARALENAHRRRAPSASSPFLNPAPMDIPWVAHVAQPRCMPSMDLADPDSTRPRAPNSRVDVNPAQAEKLVRRLGPHFRRDPRRWPTPASPCPISRSPARLKATVAVEASRGRVAERRGRPARATTRRSKDEYVVLSAHLDHLGIGEPDQRRPIYNGAMDNASGSRRRCSTWRRASQGSGAKPAPVGPVRRGHGRREGPARLAVLRRTSHRRPKADRRRHQRRHVPAALPAENV